MVGKSIAGLLTVGLLLSALSACREEPKTPREESLVDQLKKGTDDERADAADQLGDMKNVSETTVDELGKALKDPAPKVRGAAADALAEIGSERALKELKDNRDQGEEVRDAYNDALVKLRQQARDGDEGAKNVLNAVGEALEESGEAVKESAQEVERQVRPE